MDQYNGGNGGGYPPQGGNVPPQGDNAPLQQGGYVPPQQGYVPPQQGGYVPPQQGGYVPPQTAYMPPQAPPKKKKLWLLIGGAAVIVIAVVLVLVLTLGKGGTVSDPTDPVLFVEDGDVYLAVGTESILLEDAAWASGYEGDYLDAWMLYDGSTLFYLADIGKSGEGDLMSIALGNANAEPECVAEDVYTARISADGKQILYISDAEDSVGDLYLCSPGGKPEQIDDSVWSSHYGFSPNGKMFYYLQEDSKGNQTLMMGKGNEPEEITDIDESWASDVYLDDSGRILFNAYDTDEGEYTLYLYANGDVDRISRDAYYLTTFGSAVEYLYCTGDDELYYVNGSDETCITDQWYNLRFPKSAWKSQDPRVAHEAHFLFGEGESYEEITMYEYSATGESVKIGRRNGGYAIDENLHYIAYEWDDTLYLSRKESRGWSSREEICEYTIDFDIDEAGRYLYYISCDEGEYSGDLCRVPLAGGDEEVLLKDVTEFLLWEGGVYALTDENEAYIVLNEDDSERLEKDITDFYRTEGGIYLAGEDGELYFYGGGDVERLSREASVVDIYGVIGSAES